MANEEKTYAQFFIACLPPKSTHQASLRIMKRKDGSQFVGKAQSSKGAQVESDLLNLLRPHAPPQPLEGPLYLQVSWQYPYRKSERKALVRDRRTINCDKRPDIDNLLKLLMDAMTRLGFWQDDSQVAHLLFRKVYDSAPGIFVKICDPDPFTLGCGAVERGRGMNGLD